MPLPNAAPLVSVSRCQFQQHIFYSRCWECPIVSHHWFFYIYHHLLSVRRDRSELSPFQPGAFPPLACLISKGFPSVIAGVVNIPFVPVRADTDVHLFGRISTPPENLKSGSSPDRDVTHSALSLQPLPATALSPIILYDQYPAWFTSPLHSIHITPLLR